MEKGTLGLVRRLCDRDFPVAVMHYENFGKIFCRSQPLYIIPSGDREAQNFLKIQGTLNCWGRWLLLTSLMPVTLLLHNVYVPINCQFLVVQDNHLLEFYHIAKDSTLHNNSVCEWHESVLRCVHGSFYDRRNNLQGLQLRAVTKNSLPFISVVKNVTHVEVSSFVGNVWHVLEKSMNFTTQYDVSSAQTYNDLVAAVTEGNVDLALSYVTVTWQRAAIVDFTSPLLFSSYYVYIKKLQATRTLGNTFLKPFSYGIWVSINFSLCGVAAVMGMIYCTLHHIGVEPRVPSLSSCLLTTYRVFCSQGQARLPRSSSLRMLLISVYLTAVTVVAAYSATLIASLTVQRVSLPFKDIEGLLKNGKYKFGMARGSAEHSIVENSSDITLHQLSENLKDPSVPKEALTGLKYVCEDKFAYMTTLDYAQAHKKTLPCDIVYLPNFSFRVSVAFPMQKGSPYIGIFNYNIKRMRGSGLIKKIMDDTRPKPTPEPPIPLKQMTLQDTTPLLLSLMLGTLAAVVLIVIERCLKFCGNHYMSHATSQKKRSGELKEAWRPSQNINECLLRLFYRKKLPLR
ncbi:glutamate receptor ionotropic, delta-1 [Anabrus simplex]|uniref:glutamate receptor ionotropic, delta-1 n=1 Tax=Anabrus simplex TaxID=316456 RepID=UPI0035A359E2